MNLVDLLFSYQGRIGRAQFWLVVLICAIAAVVFFIVDIFVQSAYLTLVIALVGYSPALFAAVVAGIKRLHDRNKGSWWLLVLYLVPLATFAGASLLDSGTLQSILSTVCLVVLFWAFIELGCLRGTIGPNQHGPDPVAPKPAQH
jgi:uncharacterized membrane protein YhaH (DUF805 family)